MCFAHWHLDFPALHDFTQAWCRPLYLPQGNWVSLEREMGRAAEMEMHLTSTYSAHSFKAVRRLTSG